MKVLVVGSGGREHALAWKLAQSPRVERLFIAPGNPGTAAVGENVNIASDDIAGLVQFAQNNGIDLVVPGPELPLVMGITDAMRNAGIDCFGPDQFCAQIEGSKSFAKDLMRKSGVPTANAAIFKDAEAAKKHILAGPENIVIKADGLAAGKGVIVASSHQEALEAIDAMLAKGLFGQAGSTVLIEEKLDGEEISLLCLCDGETAIPLSSAQDHKTAREHDQGPNTGGMGAYSPTPLLPDTSLEAMADLVARPILKTFAELGHPYKGILYAGLMITRDGPKVLEYNARFGDPECQPLMMRLQGDLCELLQACCKGQLAGKKPSFDPRYALGVVLTANGYPEDYHKGQPIKGIEEAEQQSDARVFISGATKDGDQLLANGGRVLCVTAFGNTLPQAQSAAYASLARISMPDSRYRKDIGFKGILRLRMLAN